MVPTGAPIARVRRAWTAEEKAELLVLFADSGMTAADFCAEFNCSALRYFRRFRA